MVHRSVPVLVAAVALSACDPPPGGGGPPDAGGTLWRLAELDGAPFRAEATLGFEPGGRIGGQAPCNAWGGQAEGVAPAFRAVGVASTLMACDRMAEEAAFFAALSAARRIETGAGRLVLRGGGRSLVFVPAGSP